MDVNCGIQALGHGNREYARQDKFGIGEMRTEVNGQQPSELAWNPAYENGLCLD